MKILFMNGLVSSGSTGKIVSSIANDLVNRGHEVKAIVGFHPTEQQISSFPGEIINTIDHKYQYYFHNIMGKTFDKCGYYSKRETKKAFAKLNDWEPDVIQIHNVHGYWIHLPTLFSWLKKLGKPIVWTIHDQWMFTGHCSFLPPSHCNLVKTGCAGRCPGLKIYPRAWFWGRNRRNFQDKKKWIESINNQITFVGVSDWISQFIRDSLIETPNVITIRNGVDQNVFAPTEREFRKKYNIDDTIMLLGVSFVWSKGKGLEEFKRLAHELPSNYQIVMVGVSDALKDDLPKNIIAIPKTDSQKELADIYSSADIFVNPTYNETFGMVNLEAQMCGTPCISYNSGGTPSSIISKDSILVERGDYEALKKAVLEMKPKRIDLSQTDMLTSERMSDEYCNLVEKIVVEVHQKSDFN